MGIMDSSSAIYVSVNGTLKYTRRLRNKKEIQNIIDALKKTGTHWEKNEDKRISQIKAAIQNDDSIAVAKLIKSYYQKQKQERLKINDSNMLKKAEQFLFSEIAEVLHIDYNKVRTQIF